MQAAHVPPSAPPTVVGGGQTWQVDLVVGADGVDSAIRRRLAPEATVVSAGCTAWRALIPWYRAAGLVESLGRQSVGASGGETVGGGHRFRYAVVGHRGSPSSSSHGGIYWTATVPGAARPESPDASAGPAAALVRRLALPDRRPDRGDRAGRSDPARGRRTLAGAAHVRNGAGRAGYALVGDAAHAMSHHLGTGACLALEDAAARPSRRSGRPGPVAMAASAACRKHSTRTRTDGAGT